MANPIPIRDLYQPTTLIRRGQEGTEEEEATFSEFIDRRSDAVIFAGPGWGKTTFLHWIYQQMARSEEYVPLLFTLRKPDICDDLEEFVNQLESGRTVSKKRTIVVLVDGYDEIGRDQQQRVSAALERYRSLDVGRFFLTCRQFYDIIDLKAEHCQLSSFSHEDALRFVRAFSKAYGASIDEERLLDELLDHNLSDFASHPLMLALVCILKTGPNPAIPRRTIGLVRRAIDTLTFRWDEAKYVKRYSDVSLDGEERVRCLMRIAYEMDSPQASWIEVERSISKHLELLQAKGVDKRILLREITQWYGLIVPTDEETYQFVHRTIHDFLAARYWVESGDFGRSQPETWDTRAAYAVCLVPDGTDHLKQMLAAGTASFGAFSECLYNNAPFDMLPVAEAVTDRTMRLGFGVHNAEAATRVHITEDFFSLATDDFLRVLVEAGSNRGNQAGDAVALVALSELFRRGKRIPSQGVHRTVGAQFTSQPDRVIEVLRRPRVSKGDTTLVRFSLSEAVT